MKQKQLEPKKVAILASAVLCGIAGFCGHGVAQENWWRRDSPRIYSRCSKRCCRGEEPGQHVWLSYGRCFGDIVGWVVS